MQVELLLYSDIWNYTAGVFITSLSTAAGKDVVLRINSNGGEVKPAWGMIAKWSEHDGKKTTKTDGKADSMSAMFLCYSDYNECLDVSTFMFHRAAYPDWVESNPQYMGESEVQELQRINDHLRAAFEAKVDVEKFKKITGVSVDELFSLQGRVEVTLTAEQAQKVGLIDKVNSITPEKRKEINQLVEKQAMAIAAQSKSTLMLKEPEAPIPTNTNNSKSTNMTRQELEQNHPALVKEIEAAAALKERKRIAAWNKFQDVDAAIVAKGIESGDALEGDTMLELFEKKLNKKELNAISEDSPEKIETPGAKTETEIKAEKAKDFLAAAGIGDKPEAK